MPKKAYDIQVLIDSTGLAPEEGIKQCGSRRAYFDRLENFEAGVQQLLDTLTDAMSRKAKKELTNPLATLQRKLRDISEEKISGIIGELLATAPQCGDSIVFEKMRKILKGMTNLCKKIRDSETAPSIDDEPIEEFESKDVGEDTLCAREAEEAEVTGIPRQAEKGASMKTRPHVVFFSNLLALVERFEFDAALTEAKALLDFSYNEEIDNALKKISNCLSSFNYTDALTHAKNLASYVASLEKESGGKTLKKKILAIDDVPDVLNLLKTMLSDDYNVYCVTNHAAAIKFLSSNTPDLILLDIEMPQMDGFELLKVIRRMSSCKKIPVVFLTGNVSVENVKTSVELGGNDFIKKPVDYDILTSKLERHLKSDRT